jgi:rsbT co-antagonist protein RsbR
VEQQAEARQRALQEQIIQVQAQALAELSTPVIALTADTLLMPLIGAIDTARAQQILETLLHGVNAQRARIAILDLTGVPLIDTQVAAVLIQAAQAVRLLGAEVILTGIRPEIAQTLVTLGVDLRGVRTLSALQQGIAYALALHASGPRPGHDNRAQ